jgi:3-hydroxyisobutyrate dehydrogenase-like beta-hydroxyacid dehydrogenase
MKPVVAIIAPGAMGSAVAARLTGNGLTVLTDLQGRSAASVKRAKAAGMTAVPVARLAEADILLSIVPPGEALALAQHLASAFAGAAGKPLYVDCNAVNPETVGEIAQTLAAAKIPFADGGIIGGPPKAGTPGPTFYFSGEHARDASVLAQYGIACEVLDGPIGAASALKMSYGGITKGLTALGCIMILGAARGDAAKALYRELQASQPMLLSWFEKQIPSMFPKAYRWVAEMDEVAGFVSEDEAGHAMYEAIAAFYERIAKDDEETARLARFFEEKA